MKDPVAHGADRQSHLESDLRYYNHDRVHLGRLTNGRIPADIVLGTNKMRAQI